MFALRPICSVSFIFLAFLILGCSSSDGNNSSPLDPSVSFSQSVKSQEENPDQSGRTHLWGFYHVAIDPNTQTVSFELDRHAMFIANVVNILNKSAASLSFHLNSIDYLADYYDIDIDVSITHPFPGLSKYRGYDVRGIFIGNGSGIPEYNSDLHYPVSGSDQFMAAKTSGITKMSGPDGYTRWYNPTEFFGVAVPMFSYVPGKFASPGFDGTATLCPYKYFADNLGANGNLWAFLAETTGNGVFESGSTNTRNYRIRFPKSIGLEFGYAIIASWDGPDNHPANATESIACKTDLTDSLYYLDPANKGGNLIADISVFDWHATPSAGVMEDYKLFIESTVLTSVHEFSPTEMSPIGGGYYFSTYHVEIPADNVQSTGGNEFWLIVEYPDKTYDNPANVPNDAVGDPLAAFFRFDLPVASKVENQNPVCDLVISPDSPEMPFEGWGCFGFDATGSYDPDGDPLMFEWDFNNDGVFGDSYDSGPPDFPIKVFDNVNQNQVSVRLTDGKGGEAVCSVPVDITGYPSKNIALRDDAEARDIAIDHKTGDLLVLYSDASIWKYSIDQYYKSGSQFAVAWTSSMHNIDIAPSGYFVVTGDYSGGYPTSQGFDPSGAAIWTYYHGGPSTVHDAFATGSGGAGGVFTNDLGIIAGRPYNGDWEVIAYRAPDEDNWWEVWMHMYTISIGGENYGPDKIYYEFIAGAETDRDKDALWFVENEDCYASRWLLAGTTWWNASMVYDNMFFGTGVKTDSDDGWFDAKDITRDNQNRFFILDKLSSGEPRIKIWSIGATLSTSVGGFGNSTVIASEPLKIEGSDFNGNVVVLHGDSAPSMISVFIPCEMP